MLIYFDEPSIKSYINNNFLLVDNMYFTLIVHS